MSNMDLQLSYNEVDSEAMLASSAGSIHSFSAFRKSLCNLGAISSLNVWQNSPVKTSMAKIFFIVGKFSTLNSIFFLLR